MSSTRFNAEDVRHKAILKAAVDTFGGTLPLPRRTRTPKSSLPLNTSTPNGDATLPRQKRYHQHTPHTSHIAPYSAPHTMCVPIPSTLELSCRRLYEERMKTCKQLINDNASNADTSKQSTSSCSPLGTSVNKLRTEMINLIDQDLSLLQRLLTLNERIDGLKCHYNYNGCDCYTQQHTDDECSDAETRDTYSGKYPSPSTLSLFPTGNSHQDDSSDICSVSMCSGLDVIIDITADSDYDEALLPEKLPHKGDDEGYSTEQRPELRKK